jgi:hypothetical protein
MIKKIFANSSKFWNWLVVSSVDPQSVALTVQGFFSLTVVQTVFGLLTYVGIHPTFTLAMLSAGIVSAIYTVATIVTGIVTLYALFRKAIVTIHSLVPAPKPLTGPLDPAAPGKPTPTAAATNATPVGQ